jgi:hypothetical protein
MDRERTTNYRSRISCLNLTSLIALFVFLLCGAFTIHSSTPTLKINLNEHPIHLQDKNARLIHFESVVSFALLILLKLELSFAGFSRKKLRIQN